MTGEAAVRGGPSRRTDEPFSFARSPKSHGLLRRGEKRMKERRLHEYLSRDGCFVVRICF